MSVSIYDVFVPTTNRVFANMLVFLKKAETFAAAKKIDVGVLLNSRLAPDMLPLIKQVQIASDTVKAAAGRLSGTEIPSYADTEATLPELEARLAKTLEFINAIPAEKFAGSESRDIVLPRRSGDVQMKGLIYLLNFVLPNLYFHATTLYAILRHNGVEVGKNDFLGKLD
ncbi:MAG: DUF1993 domain-containing protein [Rudaea sp.]|uniref:DUF1993 domain-containing protein n=1 Tax=unclassified Rudaea TaxID=2627037 RepID=UPI0010F47A8E|nr:MULTISPECIES: DUF1993 domain-containing protein [unclassified Rudaea]MBN8887891.1 DUF1993 domain-containing protein [Rudaea sp.]MBR0347441.1 DUF1993 domain-containing protein [Rudaea sp.]